MTRIRVVIADDHPIVIVGLEALFSTESDIEVVAQALNGTDALEAVRVHGPDVLLVDRNMPGVNGIQVLRELSAEKAPTRVVLLGATLSDDDIARALRLGARGAVLKEHAARELLQCVRTVARGGWWLDHGRETAAVEVLLRQTDDDDSDLTAREQELALLASEGLRNKEIAARLGITEGTVKIHLNRVYRKLGVDSRVALILRVRELGFGR